MRTITLWQAPKTPGQPYDCYLQGILSKGSDAIHYYKYTVDSVGTLQLSSNQFTEWKIPHLGAPNSRGGINGICLGRDDSIWGSLRDCNQIFQLQCGTNVVTCFSSADPSSGKPAAFPFSSPGAIRTDSGGRAWYCGFGNGSRGPMRGPQVGCFGAPYKKAEFWIIQGLPLVTLSDLYMNPAGNVVWCSLYHQQPQAHAAIPLIGYFDLKLNLFTYWYVPMTVPSGPRFVGCRSMAVDNERDPSCLWLTCETTSGNFILRFDLSSKTFLSYIINGCQGYTLTKDPVEVRLDET